MPSLSCTPRQRMAEGPGLPSPTPAHLHQVHTELLERLQQAGVLDLLDDEHALRGLVPRQTLAGRVLDVPWRGEGRSLRDRRRVPGSVALVADRPPLTVPGRAPPPRHLVAPDTRACSFSSSRPSLPAPLTDLLQDQPEPAALRLVPSLLPVGRQASQKH